MTAIPHPAARETKWPTSVAVSYALERHLISAGPKPWASKYAARDAPTVLIMWFVTFDVMPDGSVIIPTTPVAFRTCLYMLGVEADAMVVGVEWRTRGFFGVNVEDPCQCPVGLGASGPRFSGETNKNRLVQRVAHKARNTRLCERLPEVRDMGDSDNWANPSETGSAASSPTLSPPRIKSRSASLSVYAFL